MNRLMLAGLVVAAMSTTAIAGGKSACVKFEGATYCVDGLDSRQAKRAARSVHAKPGGLKLADDHAASCPKGVPPDGKLHVVACGSESPSGWCRKKCVQN